MAVETWALSPLGREKNDLFNTVREHLTLNLCETVPDRNTMENRRKATKSYAERRGERDRERVTEKRRGERVGPSWSALRRAAGLAEI